MYVEYKNINRTTHMQAAVKRLAAQTQRILQEATEHILFPQAILI